MRAAATAGARRSDACGCAGSSSGGCETKGAAVARTALDYPFDASSSYLSPVYVQHGRHDRHGDLRARPDRGPQDVLMRGVRAAPARAQTVDGHGDRGGEVAGVAGTAAPGADDRAARQLGG